MRQSPRIGPAAVRDALGAAGDETGDDSPANGRAVSNYLRGTAA